MPKYAPVCVCNPQINLMHHLLIIIVNLQGQISAVTIFIAFTEP